MNADLYHALSLLGRSGKGTAALVSMLVDDAGVPTPGELSGADLAACQAVDSIRRDPSIGAVEAMRSLRAAARAATRE